MIREGKRKEKRGKRRTMAEVWVTMDVGNDGVAIIAISNPPVNALAIPSELLVFFFFSFKVKFKK